MELGVLMLYNVIYFVLAGVGSAILTWLFLRQKSIALLLDQPNHRSMHTTPTPRGGGVAMVAVFTCLTGVGWGLGHIDLFTALILVPGLAIAMVGWIDDQRSLSAGLRLLVQFGAVMLMLAIFAVYYGWFVYTEPYAVLLGLGVMIALVWVINLYNFMDGINGLASIEALFLALAGLVLFYSSGHTAPLVMLAVLGGVVLGFLPWNFPVARVFMGDVGSGFLGFVIAVLLWDALVWDPHLFAGLVILFAVFWVDASYTLGVRLLRGAPLLHAHREHAYQHAARRLVSHARVTFSVLLLNVVWLFPLAWLVTNRHLSVWIGVLLACVPLLFLAWHYRAGQELD